MRAATYRRNSYSASSGVLSPGRFRFTRNHSPREVELLALRQLLVRGGRGVVLAGQLLGLTDAECGFQ